MRAARLRMRTTTWPEVEVLEVVLPAEGSYVEGKRPLSFTLRGRGGLAISFQGGDDSDLGDLLVQQAEGSGVRVCHRTFGRESN